MDLEDVESFPLFIFSDPVKSIAVDECRGRVQIEKGVDRPATHFLREILGRVEIESLFGSFEPEGNSSGKRALQRPGLKLVKDAGISNKLLNVIVGDLLGDILKADFRALSNDLAQAAGGVLLGRGLLELMSFTHANLLMRIINYNRVIHIEMYLRRSLYSEFHVYSTQKSFKSEFEIFTSDNFPLPSASFHDKILVFAVSGIDLMVKLEFCARLSNKASPSIFTSS